MPCCVPASGRAQARAWMLGSRSCGEGPCKKSPSRAPSAPGARKPSLPVSLCLGAPAWGEECGRGRVSDRRPPLGSRPRRVPDGADRRPDLVEWPHVAGLACR